MTPQEVLQCISQLRPNNTFYFDGECTIDNIVWDSDDVTLPTTSEMEEHWKVVSGIRFTKELREERNKRLAEVDWVFSTDYQIEDTLYKEWLAYRRALRDLPSVTEDPTNPAWPEKPETPTGKTEGIQTPHFVATLMTENSQLRSKVTALERKSTKFELDIIDMKRRIQKVET